MNNALLYTALFVTSLIFSGSITLTAQTVESSLDQDHTSLDQIYLQTDRTIYAAGEDVYFKVYIQTNSPSNQKNGVLYADLINTNSEITSTLKIKINDGTGVGNFSLNSSATDGFYMIRAYTDEMRNHDDVNFFRKEIYVKNKLDHTHNFKEIIASKYNK